VVIPAGTVQLPLPAVNVITQSFPLAIALAVNPETVGVQSAFVRALAGAAVNTEIAERLETAKTKGKNEETRRRALRMKTALFTAIPVVSYLVPQTVAHFLTRRCLN
jgi:hypothetical protein